MTVQEATRKPQVRKKPQVAIMNAVHDLPVLAARDLGYFKDEGLDIEFITTPGMAQVTTKHFVKFETVFDAFAEAKRLYVEKLRAGKIDKPAAADEMYRRVMEITGGDPLPYGIEPNRRTLEELISSARDQGILSRAPAIEDLFARGTRDLVG